jgi:hypothetical protein
MKAKTSMEKRSMSRPGHRFLIGTLYAVIAIALLAGCDKKGDAIATADQADTKASIVAPGIA